MPRELENWLLMGEKTYLTSEVLGVETDNRSVVLLKILSQLLLMLWGLMTIKYMLDFSWKLVKIKI